MNELIFLLNIYYYINFSSKYYHFLIKIIDIDIYNKRYLDYRKIYR